MGNPSNSPLVVTCTRPDPSKFTMNRSKFRPSGFSWFVEKMMRSPSGWKNGAKFAPPSAVTWR